MKDSTREISPLRKRMLEDMRLRKLAPQTQASYVRSVRRLAGYLRQPPDTATVEDLRNFQLHLVDRGTSPITLNATITGLKFFFDVTLDRSELMAKMKPVVCATDFAGRFESRGSQFADRCGPRTGSIRQHSQLPMAPGFAPVRSGRLRSETLIASA